MPAKLMRVFFFFFLFKKKKKNARRPRYSEPFYRKTLSHALL